MLKMSEDDIQNGQIKSQNDLDKNNLEQPKGKQSKLKHQPNNDKKIRQSLSKALFCCPW